MSPVTTALKERGVPIQIVVRLVRGLGDPQTLDDALINLSKRKASECAGLTRFEQALINPLCAEYSTATDCPNVD